MATHSSKRLLPGMVMDLYLPPETETVLINLLKCAPGRELLLHTISLAGRSMQLEPPVRMGSKERLVASQSS